MIISILIPNFWIVVEEQRCPELRERPVVIGDSFLAKSGGYAKVLMSNTLAAEFGVRPGVSLAHARQLCPEAIFLSPEAPLYTGVWDEVLALLLTYTPLVQSLDPGEAICDVTGCERLFGDPVTMAGDITSQIKSSLGLPAHAGVASNRLVAQLAASNLVTRGASSSIQSHGGTEVVQSSKFKVQSDNARTANSEQRTAPPKLATRNSQLTVRNSQLAFIPPGRESSFLAPFPVTSLPEIDSETLLAFQVLGIKTVEHLSRITEKALATRFGPLGARLARYARGQDDRSVQPAARNPAISVSRRPDNDIFEGLYLDALIPRLVELLAADLTSALKEHRLAGRLLRLVVRAPREVQGSKFKVQSGERPANSEQSIRPLLEVIATGRPPGDPTLNVESSTLNLDEQQFFPNQDSRIHSMLPQPKQPGRTRCLDPMPGLAGPTAEGKSSSCEPHRLDESNSAQPQAGIAIRAMARVATKRPVDDPRTISELTRRLFERVLMNLDAHQQPESAFGQSENFNSPLATRNSQLATRNSSFATGQAHHWLMEPGVELLLEMSCFAPPEQMTLPGLDGRPLDSRVLKLQRQEQVLAGRFGATPFRHLDAVNLDSVLSERVFRWGTGMGR